MLVKTGPGVIEVDEHFSRLRVHKATLFNFDHDGDELKPEFAEHLIRNVIPLLRDNQGQIWAIIPGLTK
jgi:hypothetical protein